MRFVLNCSLLGMPLLLYLRCAECGNVACLFIHVGQKTELEGFSIYGGAVLEFVSIPAGDIESNGKSGREGLSDCRLMDHKNGTELVLTYKDKDGDWMLVGDVPWR